MSFRSLRSGRLDEFIFSGSEARRAMGQAEVSLTINNDSGALPIDYTEVTVTRRAARGGEGEYLLNDTVCRLRDIQMLFLGTGLGGRSYSLIGQGHVDSVLNAGPAERRQLLEGAAGPARYKHRRPPRSAHSWIAIAPARQRSRACGRRLSALFSRLSRTCLRARRLCRCSRNGGAPQPPSVHA